MNMKFYKRIAPYYDDIFPYNSIQKDFVLSTSDGQNQEKYILDIGCGTGNLALELSDHFDKVIGIDIDQEMIGLARAKAKALGSRAEFECMGMLEIERHFIDCLFDLIACFGNTLVHLGDSGEIESFLSKARKLLKPGGKLLVQIVHYDRILIQDIRSLPLIENHRIRFERFYCLRKDSGKINFETTLFIKNTGRTIKNSIELYPVMKEEIELLLFNAGYADIMYYGSFKGEMLSENSIPLIIEAR